MADLEPDRIAESVRCPYCGSTDVYDCGEVWHYGMHHIECNECGSASELQIDGSPGGSDG